MMLLVWSVESDLPSVVLPSMFADLRINKTVQQILCNTEREDRSEILYAKKNIN